MIKRLIQALLLVALAATPAHAWVAQKAAATTGTSQVLLGASFGNTTADRWMPLDVSQNGATTSQPTTVFATAGTISSLRAYATTALTGTQTFTITLVKNGTNQSFTCTLDSTHQTCTSVGSAISFVAGDYASLLAHPANTPATTQLSYSAVFTPTVANETILHGFSGSAFSNSVLNSLPMGGGTPGTGATSNSYPDGGTVDKLYVVSNAPGGVASYAYDVGLGGVSQSFVCSVTGAGTTCNDTTHTVTVTGASGSTAGSNTALRATPSGTPTAAVAGFGMRYVPTTAGAFAVISPQAGTVDQSVATLYYPIQSGVGSGSTTEATMLQVSNSMTITKFAVKSTVAPGASTTRRFTLRKNQVDTALTCDLAGATQTACSSTGSISVADSDLLSISDAVAAGAPSSGAPAFSILATR